MRQKLINKYVYTYDLDFDEAEHAAMEFERLVEQEGWSISDKSTEKMAIELLRSKPKARPKDNFKKYNETAYRQGKSIAREKLNNFKEEDLKIDSDEDFLKTVETKFDELKEEDVSWNVVRYEIQEALEKKLRTKQVKKKIVEALDKHSNYNYTTNELHVEADKIIKMISEEQSEYIKDKIIFEMHHADIKKEKTTIKNKLLKIFNSKNFWDGASKAIGKNIFKKVSEKFIHALALIILTLISGGTIGIF